MKPVGPFDSRQDAQLGHDIEALFAVEPSPEFAPRLRSSIANTPEPYGRKFWWMFAIPGVITAGVLLILSFRTHEVIRPEASRGSAVIVEHRVESTPGIVKSPPHSGGSSKPERTQPSLLVAADEASALHRLLNSSSVQLPSGLSPASTTEELRLPQIDVNPLPAPAPIPMEPIEPVPLTGEEGAL